MNERVTEQILRFTGSPMFLFFTKVILFYFFPLHVTYNITLVSGVGLSDEALV